jgi:hypothetical protein
MRALLNLTTEIAARYLENLEDRNVAPSPEALVGPSESYRWQGSTSRSDAMTGQFPNDPDSGSS